MKMGPCAGKPAEVAMLVNIPGLVTAYFMDHQVVHEEIARY
jgi:hypothetical protein